VNREGAKKLKGKKDSARMFIFPVCVLACYGILCAIEPHKALIAMKTSGNLLLSIALTTCPRLCDNACVKSLL